MSINQRLALGFALLTAVMVGFAMHVHVSVAEVRDEFRSYHTATSKRLALSARFERDTLYAALALRGYIAFPTDDYGLRMNDAIVRAYETLEALETSTQTLTDAAQVTQGLHASLDHYVELARRYAETVLSGADLGDLEQRLSLARDQMLARNRQIGMRFEDAARDHLARVEDDLRQMVRRVGMTAVFAILMFAVLGLLLAGSVRRPIGHMVKAARRWQDGDHQATLALAADYATRAGRYGTELHLLVSTLGKAAEAVHQREVRLAADTTLCRQMMASLDAGELGSAMLQELVKHLDAAGAVLYQWHEEHQYLLPLAGHRLLPLQTEMTMDDGLPGAAARAGEIIVLNEVPTGEQLHVKLGYDLLQPSHAAAVPVHFGSDLLGVIVVVQMRTFEIRDLDFLRSAANLLALGLHNSNAHQRLATLLEELRASHVETQRANEELQAQNEEIQSQNEEIQAQHEELQDQNRRLADLTDNLRKHSEEIQAADLRKTEFLATLAHELRNPMAPISTSVSLLRRSCPKDDRSIAALTTIERQSNHLIRLIEDLLDLTRISRAKIELKRKPVDLVALVADCVDDHRPAISDKRISLSMTRPESSLFVHADPDRIVQVIGNLLHNALKFTPEQGWIKVEVDGTQSMVTVTVVDSGCGMTVDLLDTLFQPFAQGPGGLDRKHGGLGLGLTLVKGLVEQHGGTVTAASDGPDQGSRFVFTLPRHHPAPDAEVDTSERGRAVQRILVVDDNVDAANMLQLALEWDGYTVSVTHDGLSVTEHADEFRPDAILCDIGLPGIDGYEVARRLRTSRLHRRIPLIAVTGYASGDDRELSRNAGFDQHLAKPVDMSQLSDLLRGLTVPDLDADDDGAVASA